MKELVEKLGSYVIYLILSTPKPKQNIVRHDKNISITHTEKANDKLGKISVIII